MHFTDTRQGNRKSLGKSPRLNPFQVINGGWFRRGVALRIQSSPHAVRCTRLDMRYHLA